MKRIREVFNNVITDFSQVDWAYRYLCEAHKRRKVISQTVFQGKHYQEEITSSRIAFYVFHYLREHWEQGGLKLRILEQSNENMTRKERKQFRKKKGRRK